MLGVRAERRRVVGVPEGVGVLRLAALAQDDGIWGGVVNRVR